jgi:RHS repeat-associated protein
MNQRFIKTALLTVGLAASPARADFTNPDNPPVSYCCGCIYSPVTVTQQETTTNLILMGPESIEKTGSVIIHQDKTGHYRLSFTILNDCEGDPYVVLTDKDGHRWSGAGVTVNLDLIAYEVKLPLTVRVYCPGGDLCRIGTLDATCRSCEQVCPLGAGDLEGSVDSSGAGGAQGEFSGSFGIGTSDQGDTSTSLGFAINPTQNLTVGNFKIRSSGGYTRADIPSTTDPTIATGTSITTGTTITTFAADANTVTVTMASQYGTPATFRSIVFDNSVTGTLKATVTDHVNSSTSYVEWSYTAPTITEPVPKWEHVSGSGLRLEVLTRTYDDPNNPTERFDRRKTYEGTTHPVTGTVTAASETSADLISDVATTYTLWGTQWRRTMEAIDPDGANLATIWEYYQAGAATGDSSHAGTGLPSAIYHYDGRKEVHSYTSTTHIVHTNFAGVNTNLHRTTTWETAKNVSTTEVVGTSLASRVDVSFNDTAKSRTTKTYTSSSNYLTTVTYYGNLGGSYGASPTRVVHADKTATVYSRPTSPAGIKTVVVKTGYAGTDGLGTVSEGTSTESKYTITGQLQSRATTDIETDTVLDSMTVIDWDPLGRPEEIAYFPSDVSTGANPKWTESLTYDCCGVATETDRYGVTTTHTYDKLKRRLTSTREFTIGGSTSTVTSGTIYDRLTTSTHRFAGTGSPGATNMISSTTTNLARTESATSGRSPDTGAMVEMSTSQTLYRNPGSTNANPNSLPNNIGWKTTAKVIQLAGETAQPRQISLYHPDGRLYRTWGDLAPATEHTYSQGTYAYTYNYLINGAVNDTTGLGGTPQESQYVYRDLAGRHYYTTGRGASETSYYNSKGQLYYAVSDGVATVFEYNSKGDRVTTARKRSGGTGVNWSADAITRTVTVPGTRGSTPVLRTTTEVWNPLAAQSNQGTLVSTTDSTPDGLSSWTESLGVATPTSTVTDPATWKTTTTYPDGTRTDTTTANGITTSVERFSNAQNPVSFASIAYIYDSVKRPQNETDSRTGTTVTTYVNEYCDAVAKITGPGNIAPGTRETAFTYDHRGRRTMTDAPDTGPLENKTYASYYPSGSPKATWGSLTNPTFSTYDYAGRLKTLTTFRNLTTSPVDPTTGGPVTTGDPATTTWNYSTFTGLLTSKLDASSQGPSYTYDYRRVRTVRNARGHWTRHDYTYGQRTASYHYLTGTEGTVLDGSASPDPETPHSFFRFDRLGRLTEASTAATLTGGSPAVSLHPGTRRIMAYRDTGTGADLRLLSDTLQVDPDFVNPETPGADIGPSLTRVFYPRYDLQGRSQGYYLHAAATTTPATGYESAATLDYDTTGQVGTATGDLDGTTRSFTYGRSYSRAAGVDTGTASGGTLSPRVFRLAAPGHTVTLGYDSQRDALLTRQSNPLAGDAISTYTYAVNNIGQRSGLAVAGTAFDTAYPAAANRPAFHTYGYDAAGGVTSDSVLSDAANSLTPFLRAYQYDTIGNRIEAREAVTAVSGTANYTADFLNQYTKAEGHALPDEDPATAPPPPSAYDADGNLRHGLLPADDEHFHILVWDGSNQLAGVVMDDEATVGYTYDAFGRLTVRTKAGTRTYTAWLGWNPRAQYTGAVHTSGNPPAITRCYTWLWGLDLSETLEGAGGVGGLLAQCVHTATNAGTYYPLYDGNGNVTQYLKQGEDTAVTLVAHFDYDPFGRFATTPYGTASLLADLPYRFSTKPLDSVTGLYYYGYRWYDPLTGRWPSRDPLEEQGGVNLYGFVGNEGVNLWDILGLGKWSDWTYLLLSKQGWDHVGGGKWPRIFFR